VSVYVSDHASQAAVTDLGAALRANPHVAAIYSETKQQAYAEFQRLYQCSAAVPPNALPASFRLALDKVTTRQRDAFVRKIYRLPGVDSVSCDPSSPCTHIRRHR
jgi:cell division protein FtsX